MDSSKVGEVYIFRLFIEPGIVTGNYYHKETNTIMFVERGRVKMKFRQVHTGEAAEIDLEPGSGIVHVPPFVALATRNISYDPAVVIIFSDRPLRSGDDYEFSLL
ncbi:MAG: hypothetical protein AAB932_04370 [Patescibacteria group bacterium]